MSGLSEGPSAPKESGGKFCYLGDGGTPTPDPKENHCLRPNTSALTATFWGVVGFLANVVQSPFWGRRAVGLPVLCRQARHPVLRLMHSQIHPIISFGAEDIQAEDSSWLPRGLPNPAVIMTHKCREPRAKASDQNQKGGCSELIRGRGGGTFKGMRVGQTVQIHPIPSLPPPATTLRPVLMMPVSTATVSYLMHKYGPAGLVTRCFNGCLDHTSHCAPVTHSHPMDMQRVWTSRSDVQGPCASQCSVATPGGTGQDRGTEDTATPSY